jgi:hypothetical protein
MLLRAHNKDKYGEVQATLSEQRETLDSQIGTKQRNLDRLSLHLSMPALVTNRQLSLKSVPWPRMEGELRHRTAARTKFQQVLSGDNISTHENNEPVY